MRLMSHRGLQRNSSRCFSTARVLQCVLLLVVLLCSLSLITAVVRTRCCDGVHCALCVSALSSGVSGERGKGLRAPPLTVSFLQPAALPHPKGSAVVVAAAPADDDAGSIVTFLKVGGVVTLEVSASAAMPSSWSSGVGQDSDGRGRQAAKAPETTASSALPAATDNVVVLASGSGGDSELPSSSPAPPPGNSSAQHPPAMHRALLGLIALVVPAAIIVLVVWWICRRTRHKQKVKEFRLNGTRQPGEVDDVDMGNVVTGGDWLNLDAVTPARTGIGASRTRFTTLVPSTVCGVRADSTFDPIGQQAEEARQRKHARRVAVAAAEASVSPAKRSNSIGSGGLASPLRGASGAAGSDTWFSDEEEHINGYSVSGCVSGGGIGVVGDSAQTHVTSSVLPGTGATSAGASSGAGPHLVGGALTSSVTTAVPPLGHNLQYFNETARVLLDRYTAESGGDVLQMPLSALPDSGGAAMQSLQRAAGNEGGSSSVVVSRPNSAFEQILSSAVAPLPVGREFHQRGNDTDGGKVADSATGSEASAAPWPRSRARSERHTGNEGLEEEYAFQADEELDEEYQDEESDDDEGPTQRHRSGAYVPGS